MPRRLGPTDQALALLYHARAATPFCSEDGEPYASIPTSLDSRNVMPLRSAAFRDWLLANYYGEFEQAPSADAIRSALRTLEARARYGETNAQKLDLRLSFEGSQFTPSKIILDLANQSGEVLEITSRGWSLADNLSKTFRESPATLPLPRPAHSETPAADALNNFAKLARLSAADRVRTLAWIVNALRPVAPYPVLVIRGPACSGKSFFARALRSLIDPSAAPLRRIPARDRELLQLAHRNWMLAFDHVRRISTRLAAALCAVSSGDAYEVPQADYRDPLVFQIARPIVLIAPTDETQTAWMPPRSLSNRTLTVDLPPIASPRPESALSAELESMRPALLAALSDSIATALRRIREIDLGNVARFPDCAAWAAAAAPALGLDERSIVDAITDPDAVWIGSDPLRDALCTLLRANPVWKGDATALLAELRAVAPFAILPPTPRALSQALGSTDGIRVERSVGSAGHRTLTVTRISRAADRPAGTDASCFLLPTL